MNVAVIGSGEIAELHAEALRRAGNPFSCAYDLSPEALQRFCEKTGARPRSSSGKILDDPLIDAVYICTRHDSHVSLAMQALNAGKKVLLEKPLAMSAKDADQLARHTQIEHLRVGYNMRHTPAIRRFREILSENAVCAESFEAHMICAPFFGGWAGDPETGGGVLVCEGSHMIDLIANTLGSPVASVFARTLHMRTDPERCPDYASLMVTLENGAVGTLLLHDQGIYPYHVDPGEKMVSLTVYSSQGTYSVEAYGSVFYGNKQGYFTEKPAAGLDRITAWGYEEQARLFLKGSTRLCDYEEAFRTAQTVDAAKRSAADQTWVSL